MMRRTDFKQLADGRWFIGYEDDASWRLVGWGVLEEATSANALAVLVAAMARHGRPPRS